MAETVFLRLLPYEDKAAALAEAVTAVRDGITGGPTVYVADPVSFSRIPGSPFAYWVSDDLRQKFVELPPFEGNGRTVKQGLATADDFRFVRAWWEVEPEKIVAGMAATTPAEFRQQTFQGKRWVLFAKGGEYSPYYADVHLVMNWERDGKEIKSRVNVETGKPFSNVWQLKQTELEFFFRPGLTWPLRAHRFAPMVLPAGCVFSVRGYAILTDVPVLWWVLALGNSVVFDYLFKTMLGRFGFPEFIVGVLQKVPMPKISANIAQDLSNYAKTIVQIKRDWDRGNELSHAFCLPFVLSHRLESITQSLGSITRQGSAKDVTIEQMEHAINGVSFSLYGINKADRRVIERGLINHQAEEFALEDGDELVDESCRVDSRQLVADLLSYAVGCVFGRWDVRMALDPSLLPRLQDPFDPLPACSPSMLVGPDGLPARPGSIASEEWLRAQPDAITLPPADTVGRDTIADTEYPLRLDWDGILADDEGHPDDIVGRVMEVLALFWPERIEAIEQEACSILEVTSLRHYFRKPGKGGFFDYHLKRYSKSRRKAPIYWLLQSSRKNYALWLYYHRLDRDTLFKALEVYVRPRIRREENYLAELRQRRSQAGTAGLEAKSLEKAIAEQESLLSELDDFRDKLERAASLYLEPDLNDGVILNMAPLWELVPWKEPRKYWEELLQGRYEWSSISRQLRQKKV